MKKGLVLLSVVLSLVLLFSIAGCTPEKTIPNETALVAEVKATAEKAEEEETPVKAEVTPTNTEETKAEKTEATKTEEPIKEETKKEEPKEEVKEDPKVEKKEEVKEEPKVEENPEPEILTKAKAKEIALKSAGVKASNISNYEIELDKDGKTSIYEISFEEAEKEFEFEINATTGKIINKEIEEKEEETPAPKVKAIETPVYASTSLSEASAKAIALKDAGVDESKITAYKIESGSQGMIMVYEISFKSEKTKYEYKINALFGTILEAEKKAIK